MAQQNLLELAKQGNAQAIAALMNRSLQPHSITVKVNFKDDCLRILFESEQVPPQKDLVNFAFRTALELNLESVSVIKVFGRQLGEELPTWSQELDIEEMIENLKDLAELEEDVPLEQPQSSGIQCPRCRSTQLVVQQKGFSYGQAAVGSLFGTGAALTAGMAGSDEIIFTCLQCNYRWELANGHFRINPNPQPVDAKLQTLDTSTRLGCSFVGGGILFLIGLLIAAVGGLQISIYIWGFALLVFVGFLGLDTWVQSVSGSCPYCDNPITATIEEKNKSCGRCNHRFTIKNIGKNYKFYP